MVNIYVFILNHYKVLLRIFQQYVKIPFQTHVIYYNWPIGNLDQFIISSLI